MWVDVLYNEISFDSTTLEFCESMWWYATFMYFYMNEITVGFKTCQIGVYERFMATDKLNYSCDMTYYSFEDLINGAFVEPKWGQIGPNTCE